MANIFKKAGKKIGKAAKAISNDPWKLAMPILYSDQVTGAIDDGWDAITGKADRRQADKAMDEQAKAQVKQEDMMDRQLEYAKGRDDEQLGLAKDQLDYQRSVDAQQLGFATDQFNYQKGLREKEDLRREGVVSDMMESAKVRDTDVARDTGIASQNVISAATRAKAAKQRALRGMGVNPNSGRFDASGRSDALETARMEAGAKTDARFRLRDREDTMTNAARAVSINMAPTAMGLTDQRTTLNRYGLRDERVGMGSSEFASLSQNADRYGSNAKSYGNMAFQWQQAGDGKLLDTIGAGLTWAGGKGYL